ncbi:MAG TPA: DUF885 family protein, partial [Gemmatimonadales bacterium]|nr:DUF885 family protein [Gemmatimonadales bacterium]
MMWRHSLAAGALMVLGGCASQGSRGSEPDWDSFVSGFIETYFRAEPLFAVYQGRHEFDGTFPDWSAAGQQRWTQRLHQLRDSAAAFPIPASDTARSVEREYLVAAIDRDLFWQERAEWPYRNPEYYTGGMDPNVYLAREYAPLEERMRAFTRYATNLPQALAHIRANLRTPMPRSYAKIGQGRIAGLADYLDKDVPGVFAAVTDSALHRQFRAANAGAVKSLKETAAWFDDQLKTGTDAYALGPELFRDMLRMTEGVDLPLDLLEAKGKADMARNLAALREACARFAPGHAIARCIERVNERKPV